MRDDMIVINGESITESTLPNLEDLEKTIFQRLLNDSQVYSYDAMEELRFEIALRNNIVASAALMAQGEARFETFAGSQGNPAYWNITEAGGFLIREDVNPSDAITDILENSVNGIVQRHEILRTTIISVKETPLQFVNKQIQ